MRAVGQILVSIDTVVALHFSLHALCAESVDFLGNKHSPLCRRLEHCFKNTGFHSFPKSMTWLPLEGTEYRRHMKWKDILKGWDREVHIVMECFQHFTA